MKIPISRLRQLKNRQYITIHRIVIIKKKICHIKFMGFQTYVNNKFNGTHKKFIGLNKNMFTKLWFNNRTWTIIIIGWILFHMEQWNKQHVEKTNTHMFFNRAWTINIISNKLCSQRYWIQQKKLNAKQNSIEIALIPHVRNNINNYFNLTCTAEIKIEHVRNIQHIA